MAFALKHGHHVGDELRRLLDRQLERAIEALRASPPRVHQARRRLKKARALVLAARPALGAHGAISRQLRRANHLLGPLTDAETMVATLESMRGFDNVLLPEGNIARLRGALCGEVARIKAASTGICGQAARLIAKQRDALAGFEPAACGVHPTAAAVRRAHRNARTARRFAHDHPSTAAFHAWRRRIRSEADLLHLLRDVVAARLIDDERRLGQLDDCLGEMHDNAVLQQQVCAHSPLTRIETARAMRALRARARDLRRRSRLLASALDEPPRELEMRVLSLWSSWRPRIDMVEGEAWRSHA